MSRSNRAQLFVGRLGKEIRTRDLEDIFSKYGRLVRCDIKFGNQLNYAFVDYEDERDAEDAIRYENGRECHGSTMCVEWAKGPNYRFRPGGERGGGYGGGRGSYGDRDRRRSGSRDRARRGRSRSRSRSPPPRRSKGHSRSRSRSASKGASRSRSPSRSRSATPRQNGAN